MKNFSEGDNVQIVDPLTDETIGRGTVVVTSDTNAKVLVRASKSDQITKGSNVVLAEEQMWKKRG